MGIRWRCKHGTIACLADAPDAPLPPFALSCFCLQGEILLNGHPKEEGTWKRVSAYVEQVCGVGHSGSGPVARSAAWEGVPVQG